MLKSLNWFYLDQGKAFQNDATPLTTLTTLLVTGFSVFLPEEEAGLVPGLLSSLISVV